ncbi:DNA cytosine methyltransferase, partial [Pseudomonas aeruginosa]|nr:DNA cytosine methyltransferase [Pseudomonas aeruginosa]
HQGRGLSFELGGKRTSLLAHQTPLSRRGFSPKSVSGISRPLHTPLELFLIQGFPKTYKIDVGHDGRRFSNKAKVKMCGNSVSPKPYYALLKANPLFPEETMREAA